MKVISCFSSMGAGIVLALISSIHVSAADPLVSRTSYFFDTVVSVSLYDTDDEGILDKCFEKMQYYENTLSRTEEGSDVWEINHSNGSAVTVTDDTVSLIQTALTYCELSGGAFDITIAPVVDLWNFHEDGDHSIPDDANLQEALSHVDYHNIQIDGNTVTLSDPDARIDLGAVAKGYISDGIRDTLLEEGCCSAMINLGGNVTAVGTRPDGSDWKVGIREPFAKDTSSLAAVIPVDDQSVVTSGTYERYFEIDGTIYHHILDISTGYPVQNGLDSVSILSSSGTDADALSTVCFVLGTEKGLELIESLQNTEALFIDSDGKQTSSSGWPK